MIVVVEVQAAVDAAGMLATFLFSTEGWTTLPTDTPPNQHVQPRLQQAGNYKRELFAGARTFGPTRPAFGECRLINIDGALDAFARYGFDGRKYIVRMGKKGAPYPAGFTTVLVCTMKCALFDMTKSSGAVRLILRDDLIDLDKPLASEVFAGTGGVEATATASKGARKPQAFGTSFSVAPVLMDENNLIYNIGLPPAGLGTHPFRVQDGGVDLSPYPTTVTEQPDYATLLAQTVPSGSYAQCSALGLIKVGLKPTFQLTCATVVGSAASASSVANVLQHMALKAGFAPSSIAAADITVINAARSGSYGYWVGDEETALSAMSKMASSASVWVAMDATATLRMGLFDPPSGVAVHQFNIRNVLSIQRLDSPEASVPIWKVTARSSYVKAPQSSIAAGAPSWYAQWYGREWAIETPYTAPGVLAKHPNAGELTRDIYTATASARDGDAGEGARALALYSVERDTVMITTPLTRGLLAAVDLGKITELKYPRFDWGAGKLMRIVAIGVNFDTMRAEITLWG